MTPDSALTPNVRLGGAQRHVRDVDRQLVLVALHADRRVEPLDPRRHVDAGRADGALLDVERAVADADLADLERAPRSSARRDPASAP